MVPRGRRARIPHPIDSRHCALISEGRIGRWFSGTGRSGHRVVRDTARATGHPADAFRAGSRCRKQSAGRRQCRDMLDATGPEAMRCPLSHAAGFRMPDPGDCQDAPLDPIGPAQASCQSLGLVLCRWLRSDGFACSVRTPRRQTNELVSRCRLFRAKVLEHRVKIVSESLRARFANSPDFGDDWVACVLHPSSPCVRPGCR